MSTLFIQNDFTHGEFDPRLAGRVDLDKYYKAAKRLRNVFVLPQGGAKRRAGTKFIDAIDANSNEYRLGNFSYSDDTHYVLVFTNENLAIYYDDAKVADVVLPYSAAEINDIRFAQYNNLMVIVHPDYQQRQLVRGATHADWTLSLFNITVYPAFDFKNNYSEMTFTVFTPDIDPYYIESSQPLFDTTYVGGVYISDGDPNNFQSPLGYARITEYVSDTTVNIYMPVTLLGKPTIGDRVFIGQPAWSDTYGWPATVTFYEGRIYFGGSRSLPETIFGSKVGNYNNFDVGLGFDSDAIVATLGSDSIQFINHIVSDRNLSIFTINGEFTPPQAAEKPLTPSTLAIRKQSNNGSTDVEPVVLDNQVFYVKKGGNGVMAYYYDLNVEAYQSYNASILSAHLINNPVDAAGYQGSSRNESDYLFLINGDGTLASYQSLREQNISAWTLSTTDGIFKRAELVGDYIYFIVERTINDVTVQYLEKLDFDVYLDSAYLNTYETPTATITGLAHLEGKEVRIRGDGYVLNNRTVVDGEIILERAVSDVEVGLHFEPIIETLPLNIASQTGSIFYKPKRVNRLYIHLYESLGVYVEDELIPFLDFGDHVLDVPPTPQTGVYQMNNLQGWDALQTITITQPDPLDMLILAIGQEVTG
jgi:hypothetical protein